MAPDPARTRAARAPRESSFRRALLAIALLAPRAAATPFQPSSVIMVRVGDGFACPSTSTAVACHKAVPVFIDEYNTNTGALVQSLPVAGVTAAADDWFTQTLVRCGDGSCATFGAGADAAGTVATAAGNDAMGFPAFTLPGNRVVVRIRYDTTIDTSTVFTTTQLPGAIKGVCSLDGTGYWVASNSSTMGMVYVPHGQGANRVVLNNGTDYLGNYVACVAVKTPTPALYFGRAENEFGYIDNPNPQSQSWTTPGMVVYGDSTTYYYGDPYTIKQVLTNAAQSFFWAVEPWIGNIYTGCKFAT